MVHLATFFTISRLTFQANYFSCLTELSFHCTERKKNCKSKLIHHLFLLSNFSLLGSFLRVKFNSTKMSKYMVLYFPIIPCTLHQTLTISHPAILLTRFFVSLLVLESLLTNMAGSCNHKNVVNIFQMTKLSHILDHLLLQDHKL